MFGVSSIINYVIYTYYYLYWSFWVRIYSTSGKFPAIKVSSQSTSHGTCITESKVRKHKFNTEGKFSLAEYTPNSLENGSAKIRSSEPTLSRSSEEESGSRSEHTLVRSSEDGYSPGSKHTSVGSTEDGSLTIHVSEHTSTGSSENESETFRSSEHSMSRSSEKESATIRSSEHSMSGSCEDESTTIRSSEHSMSRSSEDESATILSSEHSMSRSSKDESVTSRDSQHSLNSEYECIIVRYPEPCEFNSINKKMTLNNLKPNKNIEEPDLVELGINQNRGKFCNFNESFYNLTEDFTNFSARIDFIYSKYKDAARENFINQSATIKEFLDGAKSFHELSDDYEKEFSCDALNVFDKSTNLKNNNKMETQSEFSNIVQKMEVSDELDIFHSWDRLKFYSFYLLGLIFFCIFVYIMSIVFSTENDISQNRILKISYISMPLIIGVYLLHYQIVYGVTP